MAVPLVVFPLAIVDIATDPLVNTVAILLVVFPIAFVDVTIEDIAYPYHAAFTLSLPVFQFAFVDAIRKDMLSL